MRRRDLLAGVWKRVEARRDELLGEKSVDERKRRQSETLDAGGTYRLRRPEPGPPPPPPDAPPERGDPSG